MTSTIAKVTHLSVYTILSGEHREVSAIFQSLKATPNAETGRKQLFIKLKNELLSHAEAEEQTVYNVLKSRAGSESIVKEAQSEHQEMENLMNEVESMDIATDEWLLKLKELEDAVQHHVREEEDVMFKRMENVFSEDEAKELGTKFAESKNKKLEMLKNK